MSTPMRYAEFREAFNNRRLAPPDERREMERAVQSHLLDPGATKQMMGNLPGNVNEAGLWLEQIAKATVMHNRTQRPELGTDRRAVFTDPVLQWTDIPGTLPKLNRLHPSINRAMAAQDPLIQSILQNKKNRMVRHSGEARFGLQAAIEGAEGFDIIPLFKERWDELTPAEEAERREIIEFVINSGDAPRFQTNGLPNRDDLSRETFGQMLSIWVEQRYVLDAVAIEMVRTRNGRKLSGLYSVDGGTILRTDDRSWPYQDVPEAIRNPRARYVQAVQNRLYTSFGSNDLYYDYANPRDAIGSRGYGFSETEMSVKLTTGILNVLTTNNAQFDRNAIPPGILLLFGQINSNQLVDWQAEWDAYRLGAGGGFGLPALNIADPQGKVQYLRTDGDPSEMVMSTYINFLAAIRCAIFGVDVGEVNVSAFGGNNSNLSSGKDHQSRVDETRNRSFLPDMKRVANMYNEILSPMLGGRWRFGFTGLIKENPEDIWARNEKISTIDEMRVLNGQKPLGGVVGAALASNPSISQMSTLAAKDGVDLSEQKPALKQKTAPTQADAPSAQ